MGSFENTGWCIPWSTFLYNIRDYGQMTIMGLGAERLESVIFSIREQVKFQLANDYRMYVERIDNIIARA